MISLCKGMYGDQVTRWKLYCFDRNNMIEITIQKPHDRNHMIEFVFVRQSSVPPWLSLCKTTQFDVKGLNNNYLRYLNVGWTDVPNLIWTHLNNLYLQYEYLEGGTETLKTTELWNVILRLTSISIVYCLVTRLYSHRCKILGRTLPSGKLPFEC